MDAPFNIGAEVYLASGLLPIPVFGKHLPAGGATGRRGTVTDAKVNAWLSPNPRVREEAGRFAGHNNIGIRHDLTVAIDVDQGYGNKGGVAQLAQFAADRGLPPLPATWSSTARGDDSPSRQYLYRIPERIDFKTKPCKSVELCCWHHRFTVCAPSIHPATGDPYAWYLPGAPGVPPTWGERTTRYPRLDLLPVLLPEWFEAFRGAAANADADVEVTEVREFVNTFAEGEPDGLIRWLIEKWTDPANHVGHDEFKNATINAMMLGRAGHPGVRELLRVLWSRFTDYLTSAADPPRPVSEAEKLVVACADIAQRKPEPEPAGQYLGSVQMVNGQCVRVETGFFTGLPVAQQDGPEVADDDTWSAFLATFTEDRRGWMARNRERWMVEALRDRPGSATLHRHAVKAFGEVLAGHYSAATAVAFLSAAAPPGAADTTLRIALAGALAQLERATA